MKMKLWIAAAVVFALGACDQISLSQKAEAPAVEAPAPVAPPTAQEAATIVERIDTVFASNDPEQTIALYAPGAVVLSTSTNELITTREGIAADLTAYAKIQGVSVSNARQIQVLDADTIVTSSVFTLDFKRNNRPTWQVLRGSQVLQKQADGAWLIASEHLAAAPKVVAARLPALSGTVAPEQVDAPPIGAAMPNPTAMTPEKK